MMEGMKEGSSSGGGVSANGSIHVGTLCVTSADRRVAVSDGGAAVGGAGARMELPSEGGDIVHPSFLKRYYCACDRRLLQPIGTPIFPMPPAPPHPL